MTMADKTQANYKQKDLDMYKPEYILVKDIWDCLSTQEKLSQYLVRQGTDDAPEENDLYLLRLQTTKCPRAFRDGIEKASGRFGLAKFSEDTPDIIKDRETDFDGKGTNLDSFVFRLLVNLMKYGTVAVIIDLDEEGQIMCAIAPVTSIQNRSADKDGKLELLTIEHEEHILDGYAQEKQYRYYEYRADELRVWVKPDKADELVLDPEKSTLLTNAAGEPRGEVYAVWFSCDPEPKPWVPCAPPLIGLAKDCLLQMLKVSELNQVETICNIPVIKRYHPQGVDPMGPHDDIVWHSQRVIEIPFGGDVKPDEPEGKAITITHQRNNDRQAMMDQAVDTWLMEKVRTATESAIADDAQKTRLEIIAKAVQDGMQKVFRYMLLLADRRIPEDQDPGDVILSATQFNEITDEEIKLATDEFSAQTLPLRAIQKIKLQQWQSRGYDLSEEDLEDDTFPNGDILNGRTEREISTLS